MLVDSRREQPSMDVAMSSDADYCEEILPMPQLAARNRKLSGPLPYKEPWSSEPFDLTFSIYTMTSEFDAIKRRAATGFSNALIEAGVLFPVLSTKDFKVVFVPKQQMPSCFNFWKPGAQINVSQAETFCHRFNTPKHMAQFSIKLALNPKIIERRDRLIAEE